MPAQTEKQRKLFGIAQSIQEGKTPVSYSKQASKIAHTVRPSKVKEFSKKNSKKKWRTSDNGRVKY